MIADVEARFTFMLLKGMLSDGRESGLGPSDRVARCAGQAAQRQGRQEGGLSPWIGLSWCRDGCLHRSVVIRVRWAALSCMSHRQGFNSRRCHGWQPALAVWYDSTLCPGGCQKEIRKKCNVGSL
jgi:hypothetical protein